MLAYGPSYASVAGGVSWFLCNSRGIAQLAFGQRTRSQEQNTCCLALETLFETGQERVAGLKSGYRLRLVLFTLGCFVLKSTRLDGKKSCQLSWFHVFVFLLVSIGPFIYGMDKCCECIVLQCQKKFFSSLWTVCRPVSDEECH